MKRKYFFFIYLYLIGLTAALKGGEFEIAGEFLYLQTCLDNPYFVNQGSEVGLGLPTGAFPTGKRYRDHQNWHPGYRFIIDYYFSNRCAIELRWTQYSVSSHRKVVGDIAPVYNIAYTDFFIVNPGETFGEIDSRFHYKDLDLIFKTILWDSPYSLFWVQCGGKYGRLIQYQRMRFSEGPDGNQYTDHVKSKMWGVGPEIGIGFVSQLWKSLGFFSNLNASLLLSQLHSFFQGTLTTPSGILINNANLDNKPLWRGVPTIGLQFGFSCSIPFFLSCSLLELQAGYVMVNYFRAISYVLSSGDFEGTHANSMDQYSNVFLHGPYARLSVYF